MTANSRGALIQVSRGLHLEMVLAPAEDCYCEPIVKAIDAGKKWHSGLEMRLLFSSGLVARILNQFFFQQKVKGRLNSPLTSRLALCLFLIYYTKAWGAVTQSLGSPLSKVCLGFQLVLFLAIFSGFWYLSDFFIKLYSLCFICPNQW